MNDDERIFPPEPPPVTPNIQVPLHGLRRAGGVPVLGSQDRENFVRNLLTILTGSPSSASYWEHIVAPLSGSAASRGAVLTLDQVKAHLRIELDQTAEDPYLTSLEMAARIHTENVLRKTLDPAVGENVKQAMLLLIAHWYRNRESVASNTLAAVPLAYMALLSPERDYPAY